MPLKRFSTGSSTSDERVWHEPMTLKSMPKRVNAMINFTTPITTQIPTRQAGDWREKAAHRLMAYIRITLKSKAPALRLNTIDCCPRYLFSP